jgi:hypothetical protein
VDRRRPSRAAVPGSAAATLSAGIRSYISEGSADRRHNDVAGHCAAPAAVLRAVAHK